MSDAITLNYYNSNAAVFSETTKNVDFSEVQQIFTKHLSPDASILDFGCGSGRDTKYFLNNGYHVTATDGHVPPFFIYPEKNYQIYFTKCIKH